MTTAKMPIDEGGEEPAAAPSWARDRTHQTARRSAGIGRRWPPKAIAGWVRRALTTRAIIVTVTVATLVAAWAGLTWFGVDTYWQQRSRTVIAEETQLANRLLASAVAQFDAHLSSLRGLAAVLAAAPELKNQLLEHRQHRLAGVRSGEQRRRMRAEDLAWLQVGARLRQAAASLGADDIWIMDDAGDCIAASNAATPKSFVGANFADREYFLKARSQTEGSQYALGRVSQVPGLYFAHAVRYGGVFLGAVAVKGNLSQFRQHIQAGGVFIADSNGVVVLAARPQIELHALPDATVGSLGAEARKSQYDRTDFPLLALRPWRGRPDALVVGDDALPQVVATRDIAFAGIRIHATAPLPELVRAADALPWLYCAIFVGGGLLIAASGGLVGYIRALERARRRSVQALHQVESQQRQLEQLASYDALTGLPNRTLLGERMALALSRAMSGGHGVAVCYLDLDGFKEVNDSHGHGTGDHLLREMAARLKRCLRDTDTVARLGGDEFLLLIDTDTVGGSPDWEQPVRRIMNAIREPFAIGELLLDVRASVGITVFPQDSADGDTLMRHADQAMYAAKRSGKNAYQRFDAEDERRALTALSELDEIAEALGREQFVLHYQPRVDLRSGRLLGAEALIRWQHPQRGLVMPAQFLGAVENRDIIVPIGEWVVARALALAQAWQADGLPLCISVNIAARHLLRHDFATRLEQQLRAYPQLDPGRLEIEIVETAALADIEHVARTIERCRSLGVSFALDDFGTGYSSLTYLKRLPVDTLKIDKSFVLDMLVDAQDLAIVTAVLSLGKAFGREVVAEGVETEEHGRRLIALGCDQAQGYAYGKPMPAERFRAWAREQAARSDCVTPAGRRTVGAGAGSSGVPGCGTFDQRRITGEDAGNSTKSLAEIAP